jgi:hypothetical protein
MLAPGFDMDRPQAHAIRTYIFSPMEHAFSETEIRMSNAMRLITLPCVSDRCRLLAMSLSMSMRVKNIDTFDTCRN